jgi:ferredoxin
VLHVRGWVGWGGCCWCSASDGRGCGGRDKHGRFHGGSVFASAIDWRVFRRNHARRKLCRLIPAVREVEVSVVRCDGRPLTRGSRESDHRVEPDRHLHQIYLPAHALLRRRAAANRQGVAGIRSGCGCNPSRLVGHWGVVVKHADTVTVIQLRTRKVVSGNRVCELGPTEIGSIGLTSASFTSFHMVSLSGASAVHDVAMKVSVNFDLCESNALCCAAAPEVFEVRDDGFLYILNEDPPESMRAQMDDAVKSCPRRAISIDV